MLAVGALVTLGVVVALVVMAGTALAAPTLARTWRRRRIARRPFPAAWRDIVRRRVPLARELPAAHQLAMKKHRFASCLFLVLMRTGGRRRTPAGPGRAASCSRGATRAR